MCVCVRVCVCVCVCARERVCARASARARERERESGGTGGYFLMDLLGCSCCCEGITQVLAAEQDISTDLSFSMSPQPFDASPEKDAALFLLLLLLFFFPFIIASYYRLGD